jgi:hypothetical protein
MTPSTGVSGIRPLDGPPHSAAADRKHREETVASAGTKLIIAMSSQTSFDSQRSCLNADPGRESAAKE